MAWRATLEHLTISAPPIKVGFYLLYPSSGIITPMDDRYTWREPQHRKTRELMALEHPQTMTVEEYFLLE
jgi:hypothetical protein